MAAPTIYTLQNNAHAARFGLTVAQRDKFLQGCFKNREGARPRAIFCHVQEGSTVGSLNWAVNKSGGQNSYTVTAQLDGSILQCIPEQHGPWTNGVVRSPKPASKKLRDLGGNPNLYTLSIEAEGYWNKPHPQKQLDAIYWQIRTWQGKYDIPDDWVFEHADVDMVGRANCAGPYYDTIRAMMAGDQPVPEPTPQPTNLPAVLFGEAKGYRFDPKGPVSKLWLATGNVTGRFPRLVDVVMDGPRRHFVFSDGSVIVADGAKPVVLLDKIAA